MALDFPSSPQRDEARNIITNSTTINNNWPLGIPTITLSPSPDPQRMPPPPLSSSQDNFDYDSDSSTSDSSTSDSEVVPIYGFKSKNATGGDVTVMGVNAQEREIRTKNDLHPYVQTLSLADLESCVALENAAFPEEERCSREKVSEPALYLFFNLLFLWSVCDFPPFFFSFEKKEIFVFSLPNLSRRHPARYPYVYIVLKQKCQENIPSLPFPSYLQVSISNGIF